MMACRFCNDLSNSRKPYTTIENWCRDCYLLRKRWRRSVSNEPTHIRTKIRNEWKFNPWTGEAL